MAGNGVVAESDLGHPHKRRQYDSRHDNGLAEVTECSKPGTFVGEVFAGHEGRSPSHSKTLNGCSCAYQCRLSPSVALAIYCTVEHRTGRSESHILPRNGEEVVSGPAVLGSKSLINPRALERSYSITGSRVRQFLYASHLEFDAPINQGLLFRGPPTTGTADLRLDRGNGSYDKLYGPGRKV